MGKLFKEYLVNTFVLFLLIVSPFFYSFGFGSFFPLFSIIYLLSLNFPRYDIELFFIVFFTLFFAFLNIDLSKIFFCISVTLLLLKNKSLNYSLITINFVLTIFVLLVILDYFSLINFKITPYNMSYLGFFPEKSYFSYLLLFPLTYIYIFQKKIFILYTIFFIIIGGNIFILIFLLLIFIFSMISNLIGFTFLARYLIYLITIILILIYYFTSTISLEFLNSNYFAFNENEEARIFTGYLSILSSILLPFGNWQLTINPLIIIEHFTNFQNFTYIQNLYNVRPQSLFFSLINFFGIFGFYLFYIIEKNIFKQLSSHNEKYNTGLMCIFFVSFFIQGFLFPLSLVLYIIAFRSKK